MEKSIVFAPVWISQMEKSKLAPKIWISPSEKSICACIYPKIHTWVIQIFAYMRHIYGFLHCRNPILLQQFRFLQQRNPDWFQKLGFLPGEIHICLCTYTYLDNPNMCISACIYGFPRWGNPFFFAPVWMYPLGNSKQSPKIQISPLQKSIFVAAVWISLMGKSRLVSKTWISPSEKSTSASRHAHIWVTQIFVYMYAYMDFSDGQIHFLAPVWISPLEKSRLLPEIWISQL